ADLVPRIGAGGNTSLLMRARSDVDDGVIRPLFPGRAWVHGGVEFHQPVTTMGPLGFGMAAFADGVRVVKTPPGTVDPEGRQGAVNLGLGMRVRVPIIAGWFRFDWGIDPVDGSATFSTGWVSGRSP
ncbi:MAG: hypothetical protein RQ745_10580, partial [Longimicrobiales bacterium]|nr:hypothetical protein [Longimicrobiales bacterium]